MSDEMGGDGVVYLGKNGSRSGCNKWHVFPDKNGVCLCGETVVQRLSSSVSLKPWRVDGEKSAEELVCDSFGSMCRRCMEYINGRLSDGSLPDKSNYVKNRNIIEEYKEKVEG